MTKIGNIIGENIDNVEDLSKKITAYTNSIDSDKDFEKYSFTNISSKNHVYSILSNRGVIENKNSDLENYEVNLIRKTVIKGAISIVSDLDNTKKILDFNFLNHQISNKLKRYLPSNELEHDDIEYENSLNDYVDKIAVSLDFKDIHSVVPPSYEIENKLYEKIPEIIDNNIDSDNLEKILRYSKKHSV